MRFFAIAAGGEARARPWSLIGGFYREVWQSLGALEAPEAQKLLTGDAEFGYEEGTFMGDDVVSQTARDLAKLGIPYPTTSCTIPLRARFSKNLSMAYFLLLLNHIDICKFNSLIQYLEIVIELSSSNEIYRK
jgi:hypothetical protein